MFYLTQALYSTGFHGLSGWKFKKIYTLPHEILLHTNPDQIGTTAKTHHIAETN